MPRHDGRKGYRAPEHYPSWCGLETPPTQWRKVGKGEDQRCLDGAQLWSWRIWVPILVWFFSGCSEPSRRGVSSEVEVVNAG